MCVYVDLYCIVYLLTVDTTQLYVFKENTVDKTIHSSGKHRIESKFYQELYISNK